MFQALPAPLQTDPHPLSGSADRQGKASGCQASFPHLLQVCCQGSGTSPSPRLSLSPGWGWWVLEAPFLLETCLGPWVKAAGKPRGFWMVYENSSRALQASNPSRLSFCVP